MNFHKKRLLALIIVVVMLLPTLSACGGGGTKQGEPIDLVIFTQLANFSGEMQGWGAEVLRDKFNVNITIVSDTAGTLQTRMEAGFLGDIILFGHDGDAYRDASEAGLLFDWEEDALLATYGKYIYTYFPHALGKNKAITGTLHGFGHNIAGNMGDHDQFFYYPHLRWDLYKQLGMPVINTLEDFIPVLEQMVALEPLTALGTKTYAVSSFPDWDGDMVMMVKSTAALYGWYEFHMGLYCVTTGQWQNAFHPEEDGGWYLRALRFYNKLYQKGLYDPDSMTQTWDDVVGKYLSGAAMFNIFSWIAGNFNTEAHKAEGKIMMPVVAQDQKNTTFGLNVYGGNRVWAIGANSHYPELAMQIINWFASPEGVLTYNYGPLGVTWDYDDDGEPYMNALGIAALEDGDNTIIKYKNWEGPYSQGTFQHNNSTWAIDSVNPYSPSGNTFNWETWESTILNREVSEIEQTWRDWSGYNRVDDWLIANDHRSISIATTYSPSPRPPELQVVWSRLQTTLKDGSWRAIYANSDEEFDAIVAEMTAEAYAIGLEDAIEWMMVEVNRRRAAEDAVTGISRTFND